jgi:large subunit ribosomal protein L17
MIKGQKKLKLGRKASHKRALVKNLLRSLFSNGYLTTTSIKAKALRAEALKLINDLKDSNAADLRNAQIVLGTRELVTKAVEYIKSNTPAVKLLKVGFRPGDMAQTSRVSLVGFNTKKEEIKKEDKKEVKKEKIEKTNTVVNSVKNVTKKVTNVARVKTQRSTARSGL